MESSSARAEMCIVTFTLGYFKIKQLMRESKSKSYNIYQYKIRQSHKGRHAPLRYLDAINNPKVDFELSKSMYSRVKATHVTGAANELSRAKLWCAQACLLRF